MKLLLIDMDNMFWRSFHRMQGMSYLGFKTGGMYGTLRSLIYERREHPDHFMVCVWDSGSEARPLIAQEAIEKGAFEDKYTYKGNRKDDELIQQGREQKKRVTKAVRHLRLCSLKLKGFEADDVIATLVKQNSDGENMIVSNDADFFQLLRKGTVVWNPLTGETMTRKKFKRKYGIPPSRWVHVKALMGDASDNFPGAKGVGETNALKFMAEHKTVKSLLKSIEGKDDKQRSGMERRVVESKGAVRYSLRLSRFITDCPIPNDALICDEPDDTRIRKFLRKYKMGSLRQDIGELL